MKKERIDSLLFNRGLFPSRERARAAIMAGRVLVNMQKIDKAGSMVDPSAEIRLIGDNLPYVSRGGLKLKKAIDTFNIDFQDKIVADIGASTGGFTDCALQHGAKKVYAVDVGYGQLAWSLRTDARVINLERTNVRYLEAGLIADKINITTIDVAFISLDKILNKVKELLAPEGYVVALIKPQFEAGREHVGKKGVVRDPNIHRDVINKIVDLAQGLQLKVLGLGFSPIKGPEGNIEYLLFLTNSENLVANEYNVDLIVSAAHDSLSNS